MAVSVEKAVIYKHQDVFGKSFTNVKARMHNLRENEYIIEKPFNLNWFWEVRCIAYHDAVDLSDDEFVSFHDIGKTIIDGFFGNHNYY